MDGGAVGELLFYIIKFGALLISVVGVIRWWKLRKDNRKHWQTKILTTISVLITLYLFIGEYAQSKTRMTELAGVYEVQRLNCEDCFKCKATLNQNGTYKLERNGEVIDSGNWDYKDVDFDAEYLRTDLIFDGQKSSGPELDSLNIISSMKSEECVKKIMEKTYGN